MPAFAGRFKLIISRFLLLSTNYWGSIKVVYGAIRCIRIHRSSEVYWTPRSEERGLYETNLDRKPLTKRMRANKDKQRYGMREELSEPVFSQIRR